MAKAGERKGAAGPYDTVAPDPSALVEALRAFGYGPEAAIADLIDNSITAAARNIWLEFFWDGSDSHVSLRDDGRGMDAPSLVEAMRLGSRSPVETRAADDLGRFGLGLKTASFSQCRSLTVASRTTGTTTVVRRWDLDHIRETRSWQLLHGAKLPRAVQCLRPLESMVSGTIILWEKMDRICGGTERDDDAARDRFLELAERVKKHLALTFHRYMPGDRHLAMWIHDTIVTPWDPFLGDAAATQAMEEERIPFLGETIFVQPYTLPHQSRLSVDQHRMGAGTKGWNEHQGFYVYRNKRLLVDGDWLGLGFKKEEHCKLARIRIDLPNSLDDAWKVDVRKAIAVPPGQLRETLRRIAQAARGRAIAIYRHRGKVLERTHPGKDMAWRRMLRGNKVHYRINREHPLVKEALDVPRDRRQTVSAAFRLIEETVPALTIISDHAEDPERDRLPFEGAPDAQIVAVMREAYAALRRSGRTVEQALQRLAAMEPFDRYPELLQVIREEEQGGQG
jgi:hypothetical protein